MMQKFFIDNSNKKKICVLVEKAKKNNFDELCILLVHGLTVDKSEHGGFDYLSNKLNESGYDVCRFDFTGHGESEGTTVDYSLKQGTKDIKSVFDWLKNEHKYSKFVILGASFGGGPVEMYVGQNPGGVEAVIMWNAVTDYESKRIPKLPWEIKYYGSEAYNRAKKDGFSKCGSKGVPYSYKFFEDVFTLEPQEDLLKIKVPILFIHGSADTHVPMRNSTKYQPLVYDGELIVIEGAEHGFHEDWERKRASNEVIKFLTNKIKK